ncbi:DDE-domain-containing protein [Aulographum hederae CBS 113979]|uniref:DDE-domain-containing protein n=1 Tax=Aulographum hederae CBS 113979 TaxID=1176131 RepID=A0A6G1H0S7_9PEZI|nr:DDE-domain-containing protein [Aulographum hederae CBS 113979]
MGRELASWVDTRPRCSWAVQCLPSRKIASARIDGTRLPIMEAFFERVEKKARENEIPIENWWNMDEHGIAIGSQSTHRVMGDARKKTTRKKMDGNREWVSIIECINTRGRALPPVVIFKGTHLWDCWWGQDIPESWLTSTPTAYTNNEIGVAWLKEVFLPSTLPENRRPRLLFLDGHDSHISTEFMWIAYQNNVFLEYLPPHASHVLQPLDVGVFAPIKHGYRTRLEQLSQLEDHLPIKKDRFLELYHEARVHEINKSYIESGWLGTGLYPWDPEKVYGSSQVTQPPRLRPETPPEQVLNAQNRPQVLVTPTN